MRVVVTQFATTLNTQENLTTCLRVINEGVACKPSLIILPEYCNTLFCNANSGYDDHNQAWEQALTFNGDFLLRIAEQAEKHDCYIMLNVTLRRDNLNDCANHIKGDDNQAKVKSNISVTSCLISPLGEIISQVDKQILTGYEKDFFTCTNKFYEVVTLPFGKLGFLSGSDDMRFEASRELAINGAQLLCHSMSSFILDQSCLHGPARASENNVFLAAANKIGSLTPFDKNADVNESQESDDFSSRINIKPQAAFVGMGQSQIISPEGEVLAKMSNNEEGYAFADIDLATSSIKAKLRPDGTELIKQWRPELYKGKLATKQIYLDKVNNGVSQETPVTANVAIFATYKTNEQAIEDVAHYIENNVSDIIQLPELFFIADKKIINNSHHLKHIADLSKQFIKLVSSVLRPFQYVCTSLVIEGMHQAVLISEHGLIATQQQLHFCERYQWTALGDEVNIIELPLEQGKINMAMLTADDANIPEIVKVVTLNGIQVLLVPFDIQESYEVEYGLLARATEFRVCIVAASREKSFANKITTNDSNDKTNNKKKVKSQKSTGGIVNLTSDVNFLEQCKSNEFGGYLNKPLVKYQHGKIT